MGGISRWQGTSKSFAVFSICCHVSPSLLMPARRSHRQVFFGWPLFLFTWGFQVRACLVVFDVGFCNVCPINLYLLLPISLFYGICFVFIHWSLLLILSVMHVFRILYRQVLMNMWILSQCHKAVLTLHWLFLSASVSVWSAICFWVVGRLSLSCLFLARHLQL